MSGDYLTVDDCDKIRRLSGRGLSHAEIGRMVGRHPQTVCRVLNGHLTGDGPGPGRIPRNGMTTLVEATVVPWAPWVPEPDVCAERIAGLSVSERHVLELLAAGYTPKQAAKERRVSISTLRNQLNAASSKLGVSFWPHGIIVLLRAQSAA